MTFNSRPQILLLGFGKLNSALADLLLNRFADSKDGLDIIAVSRSPKQPGGNANVSLTHQSMELAADMSDSDLERLPSSPDCVVYCLTPSEMSEAGYRQTYLEPLTAVLKHYEALARDGRNAAPHLLFVSSTGVYAQEDGSVVTETSPATATRFSGRIMLEAEQRLADSSLGGTTVRFSGIYGPDRLMFLRTAMRRALYDKTPRDGGPEDLGKRAASSHTNRIHEDDCIRVLDFVIQQVLEGRRPETLYLASDIEPALKWTVEDGIVTLIDELSLDDRHRLARRLGIDPEEKPPAGSAAKSDGRSRGGDKRCVPERLLAAGFRFSYPDFRSGYSSIIETLLASPDESRSP